MRGPTKLGDVLIEIQAGKSFLTSEVLARPDELGVLKVSAVTWTDFRPDEAKALLEAYEPAESHKIKKGDFIISRANTKEFVGAVVLVDGDYPNRLLSDKTLRLVVDESRVCKEYLLFAMRNPTARKHIEAYATGTSDSMRNISHDVITSIPLHLPHLSDQKRIGLQLKTQLAEVEAARQATETALCDVESLKVATFSTTFKQIVPVAPPKNLPIAPDGWQWKKLTDIAELESGHTPSRFRPDWWGGDISWISLTEIRSLDGMWVEETQLRTNKDGIANSSARILPKGTVCFSRTASVGFVAIMAKPMSTSQDFANWVCGESLDPEFLMYALLRSRDDLRTIAEGATHKTIYMPALHSFHICVPDPSEEQRLVASLREELKSIDIVRVALEKQLSELKQLPNRILAQAFES